MSYKIVSGGIDDPGSVVQPDAVIKLIAKTNVGSVYKGSEYIALCDDSGDYSMNVSYGLHDVFIDYGQGYNMVGSINVIDDTPSPITLSVLLGYQQIPTNNMVVSAQAAAADAQTSALAANQSYLDTVALGNGGSSNIEVASSSDINAGTDNNSFITPLGLAGSDYSTMEYVTVTASQAIEPNIRYGLDSSVAGIILTLPASLDVGDTFYFSDAEGQLETNPVTIARNGHLILGLDEDFEQDVSYNALDLVYSGATQGVILA